ncbi:MAG: SRPBCC family protein [Granulosicoccus sp.]|nr:SRPBCC family protein [Granulosicoccus sp.]
MSRRSLLSFLLAASVVFTFVNTVFAHGPTRQKVTETIEINAAAADVWAAIKDFDNAASWLPMVESSSGEGGNEPGATRVLTLGPDTKIYETLKKYKADKMSYSYKIPGKTHDVNILPVTNYSSTISVKANGDKSTVTWKGAFYRGYPNNDPPEELNDEAAVAAVTSVYKAGLAHLKKLIEAGS